MLEIYFSELFSYITNPKACFQARKIRLPFFSYRSLLLSTSILNDSALTLCNMCDTGLDVTLLELTKKFPLVTSGYQLNVVILLKLLSSIVHLDML